VVEVLLSRWDKQKSLKNEYPAETKEFILSKLAYERHCQNKRTMMQEMARELFYSYAGHVKLTRDDFEPFLQEICQRSYLLREIAAGHYDFLHLSFQEYFTARELIQQADGVGTIIANLGKSWWQEPALLYVGIKQDAGPLIERLQKDVGEDIFYSNLMFAGRCIADAKFTAPNLKDEITQKLWELYRHGEFSLLQYKTGEVLYGRTRPGCHRPDT
jgi:hypothetical protein